MMMMIDMKMPIRVVGHWHKTQFTVQALVFDFPPLLYLDYVCVDLHVRGFGPVE